MSPAAAQAAAVAGVPELATPAPHLPCMGQVKWHALDTLVREYYSFLVSDAPPELIEALGERMTQLTDPAEYWRKLAEQARREVERKTNPRSRQIMITLAQTYDRLANEAEKKKPPGGDPSG